MSQLDRERVLSHIKGNVEKQVLQRVVDTAEQVMRDHKTRVTDFLDPYHSALAEDILIGIKEINFDLNGGYEEAERKRIAITPEYAQPSREDFGFCLGAATSGSKEKLNHRDYLGSLLGTGLRREKVGDLLIFPNECQFVVDSGIFDYLQLHWEQVGKSSVEIKLLSTEQWKIPEVKIDILNFTVPSLRFDAVAAQGFGLSRGKLNSMLNGEKLRLNWRPVTNPSQAVAEGDIISFRGYGRILLSQIKGKTKKGRILLELKRYR